MFFPIHYWNQIKTFSTLMLVSHSFHLFIKSEKRISKCKNIVLLTMSYSAQNKNLSVWRESNPIARTGILRDIHYTTDGTDNSIILQENKGNFKFLYFKNLQGNLRCFHRFYLRFPYRHVLCKQWLNQVFVLEECHVQGDLQP